MAKSKMTYESAKKQLNENLHNIENGNISISELPKTIKQSKELLEFCQQNLRNVKGEIKEE